MQYAITQINNRQSRITHSGCSRFSNEVRFTGYGPRYVYIKYFARFNTCHVRTFGIYGST